MTENLACRSSCRLLAGAAVAIVAVLGILIGQRAIVAWLAIGVLTSLALLLLVVRRPAIGLLMISIAAPFNDIQRIPELGFLTLTRMIGLLLSVVLAVWYFRGRRVAPLPAEGVPFLFLLFGYFVGGLNGAHLQGVGDVLSGWTSLLSYFLIFLATLQFVHREVEILWIIRATVGVAAVIGLIAIVQFTTGETLFPAFLGEAALRRGGALVHRAVGTSSNPNAGALVPVIALPLGVALWQHPSATRTHRLVTAASLMLVAGHLLLSFSRSAWLGSAFGVVLVALSTGWGNKLRLVMIGLVVILVLSLIVPMEAVYERTDVSGLPEHSLVGRLHVYRSLSAVLRQRGLTLFVGTGAGTSAEAIGRATGYRIGAHNLPVAVLLDGGIVGFIAYAWLLVIAWRRTRILAKIARKEVRLVQMALLGSVAAWQIHGLFHSYFFWVGGWMVLTLLVRYNLLVAERAWIGGWEAGNLREQGEVAGEP